MICEICHQRKATIMWHSTAIGTAQEKHEEHLQLCRECADAKADPEVLEQIRAARARGETIAVSGWTGYPIKAR